MHVIGSTSALDIPRLVVESGSDSQRLLVEVPDLGPSSVWSLDDKVSIVDEIKISLIWELRYYVEVSLNVKTELLVELTLSWFSLILINVDNSPSLVDLTVLLFHNNVSVLIVKSSINGNDLSSFVRNEPIFISEQLPPSGVDTRSSSEVAAVTIALNFNAVVLPLVASNGL